MKGLTIMQLLKNIETQGIANIRRDALAIRKDPAKSLTGGHQRSQGATHQNQNQNQKDRKTERKKERRRGEIVK